MMRNLKPYLEICGRPARRNCAGVVSWTYREQALSPWWLVALAAGVCVVALAIAAYLRSRGAEDVVRRLIESAKPDAVVLYIDIDALRRAGVLETLAGNRVAEEPEYKLFVQQSGFDYRQDLDKVAVAFEDVGMFVVASGRFQWRTLREYVTAQQGVCRNAFCRMAGSRPNATFRFSPCGRT
jgi:hypothetical protein